MGPQVSLFSTVWLILHGYADCANATLGTEIEAGVRMSIGRRWLLISFMLCGGPPMELTIVFQVLRFVLLLFCLTDGRQLKWTDICLGLVIPLVGCLEPT